MNNVKGKVRENLANESGKMERIHETEPNVESNMFLDIVKDKIKLLDTQQAASSLKVFARQNLFQYANKLGESLAFLLSDKTDIERVAIQG